MLALDPAARLFTSFRVNRRLVELNILSDLEVGPLRHAVRDDEHSALGIANEPPALLLDLSLGAGARPRVAYAQAGELSADAVPRVDELMEHHHLVLAHNRLQPGQEELELGALIERELGALPRLIIGVPQEAGADLAHPEEGVLGLLVVAPRCQYLIACHDRVVLSIARQGDGQGPRHHRGQGRLISLDRYRPVREQPVELVCHLRAEGVLLAPEVVDLSLEECRAEQTQSRPERLPAIHQVHLRPQRSRIRPERSPRQRHHGPLGRLGDLAADAPRQVPVLHRLVGGALVHDQAVEGPRELLHQARDRPEANLLPRPDPRPLRRHPLLAATHELAARHAHQASVGGHSQERSAAADHRPLLARRPRQDRHPGARAVQVPLRLPLGEVDVARDQD